MAATALLRKSQGAQRFIILSKRPAALHRAFHTYVWWNINDCKIPKGCDPFSITANIAGALANSNYDAPITFSAYGNTYLIPLHVQYALSDTGVSLKHVPYDNEVRRKIDADMLSWSHKHTGPCNCLIITGHDYPSYWLHKLAREKYNILVATPRSKVSSAVEDATKTLWRWSNLREGGLPKWTRATLHGHKEINLDSAAKNL